MVQPIATGETRRRIIIGAAIYGIFFGLMPPYVMMIVVVSTWRAPPLDLPDDRSSGRVPPPARLGQRRSVLP